jgi:soluble lytic murein transglycosylase-like protein
MFKLLISLLISPVNSSTFATKHPIYTQIVRNVPSINRDYAMVLSNNIHKVSRKYKISARIYTAILAQESKYRLNAVAKSCGLTNGKKVCVSTDFGLSQVHYLNVMRLKLDVDRLTTDMVYSLEEGAKVLAYYKRYKKYTKYWWTGYNCGIGPVERKTCQEYRRMVERYL